RREALARGQNSTAKLEFSLFAAPHGEPARTVQSDCRRDLQFEPVCRAARPAPSITFSAARTLPAPSVAMSLASSFVSALRSPDWVAMANADMSCACFASISLFP